MTELDYSNLTPMEDDLDEYLSVCFAVSGGFSKGTANVSPRDVKKLHPLLRYYAKKPHPFTACVRDNRKRFGAKTEAYCAVLKDLIVGNTKWRGKGKKYVPRALSQEEFDLEYGEFAIEIPEGFGTFLSELTDDDIQGMIEWKMPEATEFASGDIAWDDNKGANHIRAEIESELNKNEKSDEPVPEHAYSVSFWVNDLNLLNSTALVCEGGEHYYVVPFTYDKKSGEVEVSEEEDWKSIEKAWVETNLAQEPQLVAELFFDDENETKALEEDGLIWKTIMREGTWAYTPSPMGPIKKPVKIVKAGKSDRNKNVISMEELKANFEQGAVETVTVPLSHEDKPHENTGYVRKMRFGKDSQGRSTLEAALEFTEPDIKEKVLRGSIANTSAGVLWNYVKKGSGQKFNTAMGHLALTNHPWLDGLASFSDLNIENAQIISFSEHELGENISTVTLSNEVVKTNMDISRGGEEVSTEITETPEVVTVVDRSFFDELNLSEDEIRSIVDDYAKVKEEQRRSSIESKGKDWSDAGKSPALVKAAKEILFADNETVSINFSEDGVEKTLTLSDVVDRLVEASPTIDLSERLTEEEIAGETPENDPTKENERANFSDEVLALAGSLYIDGNYTEEEALKEAVKRLGNKE